MNYIDLVIKKAIEGGYDFKKATGEFSAKLYKDDLWKNVEPFLSDIFLDPEFWKCLGKRLEWGQKLYRTETGEEWGKRFCLHCGVDCAYQPPKESGCNHVHYPEACSVCSKKSITWKEHWHTLIDWFAEKKLPEEFFRELLKNEKSPN